MSATINTKIKHNLVIKCQCCDNDTDNLEYELCEDCEDNYHICGQTGRECDERNPIKGCGGICEADENIMIGNISFCIPCGENVNDKMRDYANGECDDGEGYEEWCEELCSSCGEVNKCKHQDIYKEYKFCDTCNETKRIIDDHNVECIQTTDEGCAVMEEHCIECGFRECECYH